MQRVRVIYARNEALRYTGHLDMQVVWERSIRRARLPLMYSQGFHPQPRINQACPLPLGMTSKMEVTDFWLETEVSLDEIRSILFPALPPGIEPIDLEEIDLHAPSLQIRVISAIYYATFLIPVDPERLIRSVKDVNESTSIPRIRRNKPYDLRPLILDLQIIQTILPSQPHVSMQLSVQDSATGRPEEVISALGFDPLDSRIERVQLIFLEG